MDARCAAAPRPKVLVAEDDVVSARLIREILESKGIEVLAASDGGEALFLAASAVPDLLVLDVMMPVCDGFEVCRRVKEESRKAGRMVPVLLLTSLSQRDARLQGLALGADDYLTKPFHHAELWLRVQSLLATKHLFDEMARRYQSVERTSEHQRQLATFLVHDLKNPLIGLTASLELLERALKPVTPPAQVWVDEARQAAARMLEMINTMLDVYRLEEGELALPFEPIDAEALLRASAHECEAPAALKEMDLQVRVSPAGLTFDGDRSLLLRTLGNLLINAVCYSPRGRPIRLEAILDAAAGRVRVTVTDEAPRIYPEDRELIFRKFGRAATSDAMESPGHGLGLTFCRLAVTAHGGDIWVEEGPIGNCFILSLPIKPSA
ncbi:MAG: response regulator [Deltaproteobacteria bacterium]|nr:response regulator [Deltaproteobacteria bacterium]